jgi:hypothetical protein
MKGLIIMADTITWSGGTPLKDKDAITKLEQLTGYSLPTHYVRLAKMYNSCSPSITRFKSVSGIEYNMGNLLSLNEDATNSIFRTAKKWPNLLPFAFTTDYEYICMAFDPSGHNIVICDEAVKVSNKFIAPSFTAFLDLIASTADSLFAPAPPADLAPGK